MDIAVKVHILDSAPSEVAHPEYKTAGAAGFDLQAAVTRRIAIQPRDWMLIPTGLKIEIPEGYEGQVRPRSGLALKSGVTVLNAPGTVDSDYRGEVGVILINMSGMPFTVSPGDRIAQMVIAPVARLPIQIVDEEGALSESARGSGGFGSTGQ